jgi:signal transduction histidine kinase
VIGFSNACKFTPAGGKLIIATRLILPDVPEDTDPLDIETVKIPRIEKPDIHNEKFSYRDSFRLSRDLAQDDRSVHNPVLEEDDGRVKLPLSTDHLNEHNKQHATSPLEYIIVRIEVTDTGFGIKPQDMAQSKLFCKHVLRILLVEKFRQHPFQRLLTKLNKAVNKEAKERALGLRSFDRLLR